MIHPHVLTRDSLVAAAVLAAGGGLLDVGGAVAIGAVLGIVNLLAWIYTVRGLLAGGAGGVRLAFKGAFALGLVWLLTRVDPLLPAFLGFSAPVLAMTARGLAGIPSLLGAR